MISSDRRRRQEILRWYRTFLSWDDEHRFQAIEIEENLARDKELARKNYLKAAKEEMKRSPDQAQSKASSLVESDLPRNEELAGVRFLKAATQFFSSLHEREPLLTGHEFRAELQKYFDDCAGNKYPPRIQTCWTSLVNRFLQANGLRVECLGANCKAPSYLRYYEPVRGSRGSRFQTQHSSEHPTASARPRFLKHGGPSSLPSLKVVRAPFHVDSIASDSKPTTVKS